MPLGTERPDDGCLSKTKRYGFEEIDFDSDFDFDIDFEENKPQQTDGQKENFEISFNEPEKSRSDDFEKRSRSRLAQFLKN